MALPTEHAADTTPVVPAEGTINDAGAPAPAPAAEPVPRGDSPQIDPAEFQRLQAMEADYQSLSQFADVLKQKGINSPEALQENLTMIDNLNSNEDMKAAIQAVLHPKPATSEETPRGTDPGSPLTAEDAKALMQEQFRSMFAEQETRRAEKQYNEAVTAEAALRGKVLADPRFANIAQKLGFDDAWGGKGTGAQKALAVLVDHLFFERGAGSGSEYTPVTSGEAVSQIADDAAKLLADLKAATLLDAATEPTGIEAPEEPLITPPGVNVEMEGEARVGPDPEAVQRTFKQAYDNAIARQTKLPLSQG
jgi:hypothetical protein